MRIQHNIMAMNAYRNYNNNNKSLSGNLEKLSSGYKINRAGDDAAGLAISEKMRAQITGLDAAQKNVKDGISLVKTAEGAMQEIQDMLNRMDYLATQSANGTYDNEVDRANLNKEVSALKSEINRIADSANFNGIKLLDGTWAKEATSGDTSVDTGNYDMSDLTLNKTAAATAAGTYDSIDGAMPSEATGAQITIKLKKGVNLADLAAIKTGMTNASGTITLGDLFDIKLSDGSDYDPAAGTTTGSTKIVLTAKTAGTMGTTAISAISTALAAVTLACDSSVDASGSIALGNVMHIEDGTNVGDASDAGSTNAVYDFSIDLSKVTGGTKFSIGGKEFTFVNDPDADPTDGEINIFGLDLVNGTNDAYAELQSRIDAVLGNTTHGSASATKPFDYDEGTLSGSTYTFTLTAQTAGTAGNDGQVTTMQDANGAMKIKETSAKDGPHTPAGGAHATASFKWNGNSMKAGDVITFGGKYSIELVDDADWKNEDNTNPAKMKLSDFKAGLADGSLADKLNQSLQALGYDDGNVKAVSGNAIVMEKKDMDDMTAAEWAKAGGMVQTGTPKPEPVEPEEPEETKGGETLTLQIGDTADKFNQLGVNIGDMHTKAMGTGKATIDGKEVEITETIDDIDISTQEGAQKAIYSIRNAINTVSSVRGDLGAVQNRLDHTANNLSVMAENIQDAESTIRDTDVANEMMSYVKNNILVQSAQAMLAQANQVPQGVLQLLG